MVLHRNLHWAPFAILATGLLPVGPWDVLAQSSTASCLSTFNWMQNSKNQSPCLVSAYLQGACIGGQFTVAALPPGTHYTGPYADEQNPCQCSTVTYNVVSACGLCQNHTITSWTVWNANCSTVYPGVFPPGVPEGTTIPQWAFQDVTSTNAFNLSLAQSVGDNPESVVTRAQSTGSSLPALSAASSASLATPTASTGSKSRTGAIAGGVVGGVVGLALIVGIVVFFIIRQRRSRVPPSTQFASGAPPSNYTDSTPFASQMAQPRLYDPSDPSTFPGSPHPTSVQTGQSSYEVHSNQYNHHTPMRPTAPGVYSGVPEI